MKRAALERPRTPAFGGGILNRTVQRRRYALANVRRGAFANDSESAAAATYAVTCHGDKPDRARRRADVSFREWRAEI